VDAYATAAFAMGATGPAWVARQPGYGALAVTSDERIVWTPLIDGLLVDSGAA
jgi:thiamine biosynthesis lipoprotein ApbE